ncbi:MAG: sigma-70 family RNA polymerase sigma factor [Clostridia bacterium]
MATVPDVRADTDEALVAAAQDGDRDAWHTLVVRFTPRIRWRARRFFIRGLDRDDVVQEGFVGFLQAVRTFRRGAQGFGRYADICVTRTIARAVRAPVPPLADVLADTVPDLWQDDTDVPAFAPGAPTETALQTAWLVDWMAERVGQCLRDDERLALLATLHGLTYSDVAQHLMRSERVVGRLVMRARRKLRTAADREGVY